MRGVWENRSGLRLELGGVVCSRVRGGGCGWLSRISVVFEVNGCRLESRSCVEASGDMQELKPGCLEHVKGHGEIFRFEAKYGARR